MKNTAIIKLVTEESVKYEYTFKCDNVDFMEDFRIKLKEFLTDHNGVIEKNEIKHSSGVCREFIDNKSIEIRR